MEGSTAAEDSRSRASSRMSLAQFETHGWMTTLTSPGGAAACPLLLANRECPHLVGHDGQKDASGPGSDAEFAAAFRLADPEVSRFLRLYVESQGAALVDDFAADPRRAIDVHQHQLVAGVGV